MRSSLARDHSWNPHRHVRSLSLALALGLGPLSGALRASPAPSSDPAPAPSATPAGSGSSAPSGETVQKSAAKRFGRRRGPYAVILRKAGPNPDKVAEVIRGISYLTENFARTLIERIPVRVLGSVNEELAKRGKRLLEDAGAAAEVVKIEAPITREAIADDSPPSVEAGSGSSRPSGSTPSHRPPGTDPSHPPAGSGNAGAPGATALDMKPIPHPLTEEEISRYRFGLLLKDPGENKSAIVDLVAKIVGKTADEARVMVESAPVVLFTKAPALDAWRVKLYLEAHGAVAELQHIPGETPELPSESVPVAAPKPLTINLQQVPVRPPSAN